MPQRSGDFQGVRAYLRTGNMLIRGECYGVWSTSEENLDFTVLRHPCCAVVLLLTLWAATPAWAADFDIDRASYSTDRDSLTIRDDAEDDATVRLYDDDSMILFATVTADSDGNWYYRDTDPQAIPCRVRAEAKYAPGGLEKPVRLTW